MREVRRALQASVRNAMPSPAQQALIRACIASPDGATSKQACDFGGIDKDVLLECCEKEVAEWDKRCNFIEKRYQRWEIGPSNAAPPQFQQQQGEHQIVRVRAACGSEKPHLTSFA